MKFILAGLLLAMAVLLAAAVAAYQAWGIWGAVGVAAVVVVAVFAAKALAGKLLLSLFMIPFKMKGKVLRGATIEVHAVTPAEAPPLDEEEDDAVDDEYFESLEEVAEYRRESEEVRRQAAAARARRRWRRVDVTITPRTPKGDGFTHWEPGELVLVHPSSKGHKALDSDDSEFGEIAETLIWDPQRKAFGPDEQGKYFGPQRLQLLVGVEPDLGHVAFRYYFEKFGNVPVGD
jgi:hypothetical protein